MFKFKMLTKVLVAVLYLGQLIELNVNICIALSIERARPINRVKLYKTSQFQGRIQMLSNLIEHQQQNNVELPFANQIFAASRTTSSKLPKRLLKHLEQPQARLAHQTLESTGRADYFGTIEVGTPAKKFMVLFDTMSSEFWLPSTDCQSDGCISRMRYNRSESATYKPDGRRVGLNLDGLSLEAQLSSDRIKFANFELNDVKFAEATKLIGDKLKSSPVDGYMGLGFGLRSRFQDHTTRQSNGLEYLSENNNKTLNNGANNPDEGDDLLDIIKHNGTTFAAKHFEQPETAIEMLVKQGFIEKPIFSLYLNGENDDRIYSLQSGDLILGEIDSTLFTGELTYVPVHSPQLNYWEFRLDSLELRPQFGYNAPLEIGCPSGCPAIIDTGARLIFGHFDDVDRINRRLGGLPIGNGVYRLQCELAKMPNLVFKIGNNEFILKPKDYVLTSYINGQLVECISSLKAIQSEQYPFWILGEHFLRQHYVVFDYGEKRLGFASSKHHQIQYDDNEDDERTDLLYNSNVL